MTVTKSKPAHITVASGDITVCPGCLNPIVVIQHVAESAEPTLEARCHHCEIDFIVKTKAA